MFLTRIYVTEESEALC